jgi:endonuclease YncB( thermonuclease family)
LRQYWRRQRYRQRSIWKILGDGLASLIVALVILYLLEKFPEVDFQTRVIVTDGDSFKRGSQRIRLFGIDAPELAQECLDAKSKLYACGHVAKRALQELIGEAEISCAVIERDKYGRDVARCRKQEIEINREMVRLGWAIAYDRHSIDYLVAEAMARNARRGLWQGHFRNPRDFRKEQRDAVSRGDLAEAEWMEID